MGILSRRVGFVIIFLTCLLIGCNSGGLRYGKAATAKDLIPASNQLYTLDAVFLPDGKNIVVGLSTRIPEDKGHEATISILNAETWEQKALGKFDASLSVMAVSKDGKYVAAGSSMNKKLLLWNVDGGQMTNLSEDFVIYGLAFTPGGKELVSSTPGDIRLWNIETKQSRILHQCDNSNLLAVSPDGKLLVADCKSEGLILLNIQTGEKRNLPIIKANPDSEKPAPVWHLAFSADNKTLAVVVNTGSTDAPNTKAIRLLNIQTNEIKILAESENLVTGFAFSPDGKSLASYEDNKSAKSKILRLWNIESGQSRILEESKDCEYNSLDFSPDGKSLAASCLMGGVSIIKI